MLEAWGTMNESERASERDKETLKEMFFFDTKLLYTHISCLSLSLFFCNRNVFFFSCVSSPLWCHSHDNLRAYSLFLPSNDFCYVILFSCYYYYYCYYCLHDMLISATVTKDKNECERDQYTYIHNTQKKLIDEEMEWMRCFLNSIEGTFFLSI
jgi:hypothetical protein